jgi:UDP-N-acetylglucosamine:LPS N-acetylglucosamine transferase
MMPKLCLVCSSGGHLFQLFSLKDFWKNKEHFWVTFPTQDAEYLLSEEKKYWAHFPTNRNIITLIKNIGVAWRVLKIEQPDCVISTGAGPGVPFIFLAWLFNIKTIYIESITRNEELSLSARIIYPVVDKLLVQWPEMGDKYKKAEYHGQVI